MEFLYPLGHAWNFMFQRPHQLLTAFSRLGHKAHFIDQNTGFNGINPVTEITEMEKGLYVHPPGTDYKKLNFDVLYSVHPGNFLQVKKECKPKFTVFDSVDEVVKGCFSSLNKGGAYYSAVRQADLVLATAETLFERAKEYNDNVILVPNGCDFSYFNNPQPKPNEYEQLKNPIILYSGAVATWVDLKLIKEAANVYSDYDFVIIGAEFNTHIGNIPPNLHFYGHQPYNRVASFIQYSNACIIPFKTQMAEVECCNPIKLYEYLACGKPVITTEMPETKDYSDYWGNDYFIDNIAKAVENDTLQKRKMRIEIAENNSWNERAKRIVSAIDYLN